MGENSAIEWTDHTFNPWIGCTKVSPGCTNCYAERDMDHRFGKVKWGKGSPRVRTSEANWKKPLQWNAAAVQAGKRYRVFCASLADVFDDEVPGRWRSELFDLINRTPNLDWLLLTKRPQNVVPMLRAIPHGTNHDMSLLDLMPMPNVWMGTTVEDQQRADERIPHLMEVPAVVRFLSCEPLLGPVDLRLDDLAHRDHGGRQIDWVIAGGESGPNARPMHPDWAKSLRDQVIDAHVPFLFKQWGEWGPGYNEAHFTHGGEEKHAHLWMLPNGDDGACWVIDEDGNWSNWTGEPPLTGCTVMGRHGKKAAGRWLDGQTWDGVPTP